MVYFTELPVGEAGFHRGSSDIHGEERTRITLIFTAAAYGLFQMKFHSLMASGKA